MITEYKEKWYDNISWLNIWFGIGIIISLVLVSDLINVFDFGLYSDDCIQQMINGDFIKCF